MPEGDTVWRTARALDAGLSGQVLVRSDFRLPSLATVDLAGRSVLETVSRGKHLLTRIEGGHTIATHLRMEGSWSVQRRGARWRSPEHQARVVLTTNEAEAVGFNVLLDVVATAAEGTVVGHLGPDLLGPDWDPDEAVRRLAADPGVPIADALLDQRNLAGIGNVYKVELCFLTGLHPARPVGEVPTLPRLAALAHRLLLANRDRSRRVTTGDPRRPLWVYGRRTCLRCATPIEYAELGPVGQERGTWWCPRCQPG